MKRLILILATIFLGLQVWAQYDVRHYSVEDGLSQNTIMSILQDRDGYMWFGTWDGLNKFDGYEFTTYKSHPDQIPFYNNRVDFISEDSLGYIWFQTYDGRFHRLDKSRERIFHSEYDFPLVRYNAERLLTEPKSGNLYMVSNGGILLLVEHTDGTIDEILYQLQGNAKAHFVIADNHGCVWYDDANRLCRRHTEDDEYFYIDLPASDEQTIVTTAVVSGDGLWFGGNQGKLWRYSFTDNRLEPLSLGNSASVTAIVQISQHELMIGTHEHGLYIYNSLTSNLTNMAGFNQVNHVMSLSNDSYGVVWIENDQQGIWRYRLADQSLKHLMQDIDLRYGPLRANMLIIEDSRHNIWVNPFGGGLSRYNRELDELENPLHSNLTNMIHTAYVGKGGELWLSTYETGVDCIYPRQQQFRLHDMRKTENDIGEVRAMLQLNNAEILFADKDQYITNQNDVTIFSPVVDEDMTVYCMMEQADGSLLLGTRYSGLYSLRGKTLKNLNIAPNGGKINSMAIYDMITIDDDLYIATYGGGVNILGENGFINSDNGWDDYPSGMCSRVRCLLMLGDTMLLAGTTNGLMQMRISDRKIWFTPYCDVHCLLQDSRGDVWMGTFSGGLNKVVKLADDSSAAQFRNYSVKDGLRSDIVLNLVEDNSGRIWFTSENNITRFDPLTGDFQHFTPLSASARDNFSEGKALRLQSGDIIVGYSNGYCAFSPERILRSEDIPNLHFTGFQLFNNDVAVGEENSPLKTSISYTDEIMLKSNQSVWSIEYAAIDYVNAEKIEYAFILDGFEKEWNKVKNQRKATYTNLPAGKYVFRVKSTNAEGAWVNNEHQLTLHILPSFWHTGWAVLLYILFAAILLWLTYVIVSRYNRLQQQMQVEQQMTDFRMRFFTNISHELRTPLTLISGPVENILKTEKVSTGVKTQLEIVQSNARRMLRLINEILDFRKIQNQKMRLKIQETHLWQLVEDTCGNFNKEAYDKHINFRLENNASDDIVWVDREKTDIILYNLLSNAFKFTPAGKSINVSVSDKSQFVMLRVADEGVGIPKEKRGILFERFSSHNEIENLAGKTGTGIGLNLVKELVDLHKGYIEVDSEIDKGAVFTVMFRKGKEHFGNEVDFLMSTDLLPHKQDPMQSKLENIVVKHNLPNMVVVEDNEDMRSFLKNVFEKDFTITTAKDGEDGLGKVREVCPEIVIADLMMPNMDGLDMTAHLKKDEATSHIPIILLTAKESIESRLEAMRYGADDYITKPFSAEYLKARVDNLLKQRERLRERYRNDLLTFRTSPVAREKSPDEVFLAKLLDFMEKNMDNNELIVEDMVSEMAMGRTVFFNKLKTLTGLSPVEFIREVRIKRAAQLLEVGSYNVTEVTYMVGMNDSRYFSKCFKAVYGMTPTEYKKKYTNT